MATFLDTLGILDFFAPLFSAVLVFAIVFALIIKTKVLGESKAIAAIIAAVLGILVLTIPDVVALINFIAPWFVLMFIFLALLLMMYYMFGIGEGDVVKFMNNDRGIQWALLAIGLIIILGGIFNVFGQRALEVTTEDGELAEEDSAFSELFDAIFNVKVLGLLLVFGVAIFTIAFLGGGANP